MKDCDSEEELQGLPELDTERVRVRLALREGLKPVRRVGSQLMEGLTVGLVERVPQAEAVPEREGETVVLVLWV